MKAATIPYRMQWSDSCYNNCFCSCNNEYRNQLRKQNEKSISSIADKRYFLSLACVKKRHLVEQVLNGRPAKTCVISCLFCDSSLQLFSKVELVMKRNLPIRSQCRCAHLFTVT